ncbi:PIN domain-containing protein [Rhizobium leguminosarum]|uniref:PIN domain-containing protein n=1 Tax=Rhizobium leguminosarum TaxID=384 RepID=UPI0004A2C498|nr:PIN domain-containing protein [Rhizobium leguminosarum]
MASKPPVAVYDACVLYPFHLRNVLVQCAFDGLVDARRTDDIHAEWISNLAIRLTRDTLLEATRDRIKDVLPDADVGNHRILIPDLSLPGPDDRHGLAVAIAGKASVIVTGNLKDFPAADLRPHGVTCVSPDNFLVGLHSTFSSALIDSIRRARLNLRKTVPAVHEFIDALDHQGLRAFSVVLHDKAAQLD